MSDYIKYEVRVYKNGDKIWYKNGKCHKIDGPACEYADGDNFWYKNGELHREDGPAMECIDGYKEWFLNGKEYTKAEFNKKIAKKTQ